MQPMRQSSHVAAVVPQRLLQHREDVADVRPPIRVRGGLTLNMFQVPAMQRDVIGW